MPSLVIRSFSHVKGEKRMKNAETWYQRSPYFGPDNMSGTPF